ncbi:MAG: hypothetical protein JSV05_02470 [Candidatus Bathyarchaeota archaeon]|nr:MAG: hypothetical protein JSV05_02470 [Candidatus Bathyarchaeota archaeon]
MPGNQSLRLVLAQAKEKEKEYDWFSAVKCYSEAQTNVLARKGFWKAGDIQERISFCFHRAAMQAKRKKEFRERMGLAVEASRRAREFYEKSSSKQSKPRKLRCDAAIKYYNYWLTANPEEKKQLLDDCLELEGKALSKFLDAGKSVEYVRTYNEFSLVFFCRVFLEKRRETLKSILEEGLEWGEKAIDMFAKGDPLLAGTFITLATCLSDAGYYLVSESEKIDKYRLQALDYLNKTVELSENTQNALLLGLAHLWLGINKGEEPAARHHEKALEYGKRTGDNFLKAHALDYLAYNTYWKARSRAIENPETRKELTEKAMKFYEQAHRHYKVISFINPRGGLLGPPSGHAEHFFHLALWEPNLQKKRELLNQSEQLGMDALKVAESSHMPMVIAQVLHVISKTLQAQARIEQKLRPKKKRLEKALKYRERTLAIQQELTPFFYWNLGVMINYLAGIKAELAKIEPDPAKKIKLLEGAVLSSRDCLEFCAKVMPDFERKGEITLFAPLRDYQETYANLLLRLYKLTRNPEFLKRAIDALYDGIKSADKLDMVALKAELFWKIARIQNTLGRHLEAAENFTQASKSYLRAGKKIPKLKGFFEEHAIYMQAWNEIEKAKYDHSQKQYGEAKKHYETAAILHKETMQWKYLTSNYLAWARLEAAEHFSRDEQIRKAINLFQKAAELFRATKTTLQNIVDTIETEDEKDLVNRLIKALRIREEYCQGRIALEEAKILSRKGNNAASSEGYSLAAKKFQQVLHNIEREASFTDETIKKDRQELTPIIYLSKAWELMKKAEAEASPELYLEASQLFDEAKERSIDERTRLLALGHSRFCKALETGTRFEDSRDTKLYLEATQYLESAANYYVRAGFNLASEYAIATQRLFDAYIYMDNATKEQDPEKKARYYVMAEKVLETSISSYLEAKHLAKSKQVQRLLAKVREERRLATSLSEVLNAPSMTSSTASFVTPTPSEEAAVGFEKFEQASLQVSLVVPTKRVSVGESFSLEMRISNVGRQSIMLDKIQGIMPLGFKLTSKPDYCSPENGDLNMRGRRIDPLKTEEILLELRSFESGSFQIVPKITYSQETGKQVVSELEPVAIEVLKIILQNRIPTGHAGLDTLLLGGIPETYAVMLTSPFFEERNLLIRDFLETGARKGHITFFVTIALMGLENLAEDYQPNFYLFICNPQAGSIIRNLPNVFKFKGVENLTDISIALTSILRKLRPSSDSSRRCCINIVSDVLLHHQALQSRRWLNSLLPDLKSHGFTVLAVMDPRMHSSQETSAILDLFDGEINLYEEQNVRFLRIKRLTKKEFLKFELPLNLLMKLSD